jgi:hypothetical protein
VNFGLRVQGSASVVVSEHRRSSLISIAEKRGKFLAMPPRRRDRPMEMSDPAVEMEMRELRARLDAMETTQRHTVTGDISEAESENEAGHEGEVAVEGCCR